MKGGKMTNWTIISFSRTLQQGLSSKFRIHLPDFDFTTSIQRHWLWPYNQHTEALNLTLQPAYRGTDFRLRIIFSVPLILIKLSLSTIPHSQLIKNSLRYMLCNMLLSKNVCLALLNNSNLLHINKTNSVALSPRANYTDWSTATCRRNLVPTFVDRGVSRVQRGGSLTVVNLSFLDRSRYFSFK
jgi:hypothetical protein